ncbi:MAG TPA: methyltransferase domain-containing protein [Thermoanaerobaculia bacterium]|nr:methyltransferase domain-containing protein [Thermoanaerobaculia bacterium]
MSQDPAPFCTAPGCSLANSRVLLEREVSYSRDGRTERLAFDFRLCAKCQMGFVHPVPPEDVLACFYTGDYPYFQDPGDQPEREAKSSKYRVARLRYGNRPGSLLARLVELMAKKTVTFTLGVPLTLPQDARILDYGYGMGGWLLSMRALGYTRLFGYDIAANSERRGGLAARGIEVIPSGGLSRLEAGSLDCVRLEHVFEHLDQPLAALESLHRLLRPGGLLLMTFPSIYPWLEVKNLGDPPHVDHLQLPIHLAHHSLESSRRLVGAAGFEGIATRVTARERFITLKCRKPGNEGS